MQPSKFTIAQEELDGNAAVVALTGRILMGGESETIETTTSKLVEQGKRTIIFDISGVTGLDSTGIGRFIASYNQIVAAGGEMRIAGASPRLLQVFHVNRLDTVFSFYPSVQEAAA